jgi:protein TonB
VRKTLIASALVLAAVTVMMAAPRARQAAAPPPDPEAGARAALARPINAGSIPFLVPHSRYSNVAGRLASSLSDKRADVRAVAARAIFVTAGRVYGDAVAAALPLERDPIAGAEIVRAFMALRGPAADADAVAAAKRLGAPAINAVIVTMAHARPLDVLTYLVDLDADPGALAETLLRAIAADGRRVARAIDALPSGADLAALSMMFDRADEVGAAVPSEVVEAALAHDKARHSVLMYLLNHPEPAPPAIVSALRSKAASPVDGWDDVLVELIARSRAGQLRDLRATIAGLDPDLAPSGFWRSPALARLSSDERSQIEARVPGAAAAAPSTGGTAASRLSAPDHRWTEKDGWRSIDPLPGLDAAVAAAAGCRTGANEIGVMQITYGPRGQVSAVKVAAASGSPACREAAAMLAMLEIAPISAVAPPDRTDHVVAVFTRDALECEGRSARARRTRSADRDPGVIAPRKLRDVPPVYPKDLIAARVQGTVVVEAVIERSGCVARAAVIEGAHPYLNAAALAAVAQWRYAPTTLNGEPVAVIMRMTSNFSLK